MIIPAIIWNFVISLGWLKIFIKLKCIKGIYACSIVPSGWTARSVDFAVVVTPLSWISYYLNDRCPLLHLCVALVTRFGIWSWKTRLTLIFYWCTCSYKTPWRPAYTVCDFFWELDGTWLCSEIPHQLLCILVGGGLDPTSMHK